MYQHLRKADKRHERDRIQWSDTYKRIFEVIARGRGEALIEGLNFGAAYDTPPFFEFAVVREGEPTPDIKAVGFTHEGGRLGRFAGGHTGQVDNWFYDGSFEHQGMWDPVIPDWTQDFWPAGANNQPTDSYQKIASEQSVPTPGTAQNPWGYAEHANNWIQEPTHNRWTVTSERAHTAEIGLRGKYSAKSTLDADGKSGWLIPILSPGYPLWDEPANPGRDRHYFNISHFVTINQSHGYSHPLYPFYPEGGINGPGLVSPIADGMNYEVWVWAEEDCVLENWVTFWYDAVLDEELGTYYEEHLGDRREWPVRGGRWNKVEWTSFTPSRLMPGIPNPKQADGTHANVDEYYYATVRVRAKDGTPDTKVFIDDCLGWAHLQFNDNPFVTVGVARWIRDAAGAYIGADLWVKVGEPEYSWV